MAPATRAATVASVGQTTEAIVTLYG